jgi:hypothetical protein
MLAASHLTLLVSGAQLFVSYPHRVSVCMSYKSAFMQWRPFTYNISGIEMSKPTYVPTYLPSEVQPVVAEFIEKEWNGF